MTYRSALPVVCATLWAASPAVGQQAGDPAAPATHVLKATPKTVAWGHYHARTSPVLRIRPGDTVQVHTHPCPCQSRPAWCCLGLGPSPCWATGRGDGPGAAPDVERVGEQAGPVRRASDPPWRRDDVSKK
jgi:hypothetical protein